MKSNLRTVGYVTVALLPALLLLVPHAVFAGSLNGGVGTTTSIPALDTAKTTLVTFVQALAGFACVFLLGVLVWDFVQHRNISRSIFEFLGVIVLGVIALNAGAVSQAFAGGAVI